MGNDYAENQGKMDDWQQQQAGEKPNCKHCGKTYQAHQDEVIPFCPGYTPLD